MRIITGDECGLLKESIPELSRPTTITTSSQNLSIINNNSGISRINNDVDKMCRSRGIVGLSFCNTISTNEKDVEDEKDDCGDSSRFGFCALRSNGSLEQWEGNAPRKTKQDRICGGMYNLVHTVDGIFEVKDNSSKDEKEATGRPIAMCTSQQYQGYVNNTSRNNVVACCSSFGMVSLVDTNQIEKGVVARYEAYSKTNNNSSSKLTYLKGKFTNNDIATAMAMDYDAKRIVVGGRERAATMLDVETGEKIWKAKNLPPNRQTLLQQPIWSTAIQFLSPTDTAAIGESTNLLAIGTAYKQLQIYDVRADATQRRPVIHTPEWDINKENLLDYRVTSLCQLNSNVIAVGDSAGYITSVDLRMIDNKNGRSLAANVGRFCGPAGSVRQMVKHQNLPIFACVGLDRTLRTYDTKTRKQLDCVYLKQQLNCMLFCEDGTWCNEDDTDSYEEVDTEERFIEGDINDEDEVVDYIDSSDEENLSDQEEDGDQESEMEDEETEEEDDIDEDAEESDYESKASKRRKK